MHQSSQGGTSRRQCLVNQRVMNIGTIQTYVRYVLGFFSFRHAAMEVMSRELYTLMPLMIFVCLGLTVKGKKKERRVCVAETCDLG